MMFFFIVFSCLELVVPVMKDDKHFPYYLDEWLSDQMDKSFME